MGAELRHEQNFGSEATIFRLLWSNNNVDEAAAPAGHTVDANCREQPPQALRLEKQEVTGERRALDVHARLKIWRLESMMSHLHAGLSSDTTEKARVELNENPETLHQDIQQVLSSSEGDLLLEHGVKDVPSPSVSPEIRDMIVTRPDIGFLRTDDDFILRFLRARKFDQTETFRLLAQYFQFRQQNLDMFQSFKV